MKVSIALIAVASTLSFISPVLSQDQTPEQCKAPCQAIQKIEVSKSTLHPVLFWSAKYYFKACNDTDLTCVCGDQLVKDSQDCRKCISDSGVNGSLVPGFNEILTRKSSTHFD